MDIFGTIKNGVDLAIQVRDLIDGIVGAPETLKRLGTEIREVKVLLDDCKEILSKTTEPTDTLLPLLQNVRGTLKNVEAAVLPFQIKARKDGSLSSWTSLKVSLKEREIEKYMNDFQRHKVLLSLINVSVTSRSQLSTMDKLQELETMAKNQGTRLSENETQVFFRFMQQQIDYGRMMQEVYHTFNNTMNVLLINEAQIKSEKAIAFREPRDMEDEIQSEWTCQKFLDTLSVPNIADDRENVPNADLNTCRWIYEHPAYSAWQDSTESCTLHLAGKMGSGKSVLTKDVLRRVSQDNPNPPDSDDDTAVLFYFCSRVKRPGENTSALLEALIYQFLQRRRGLFRAIEKSELLGNQNLSGKDNTRSIRSLWKILGALFRASRHSTIYCIVDALDECDATSTKAFLSQYEDRQDSEGFSSKTVKFFISSRSNLNIMSGLHRHPRVPIHHLPVTTASVTPDIELVLNKHLDIIAEELCLDVEEQRQLQMEITAKADGMFQWVNTALKVIGNADGSTFESLLQLVQDLPTELQDLYNGCLLSLVESLERSDVELIRKLLAWILLGMRPLTLSELMLVLAIRPEDTALPPRNRLHKSIGRFITRCLAPFVEIVPSQAQLSAKSQSKPLLLLPPPSVPQSPPAPPFVYPSSLAPPSVSPSSLALPSVSPSSFAPPSVSLSSLAPPSHPPSSFHRNTNPLDIFKDLDATVRPVHNSAQEFLLDICTKKSLESPLSVLQLDKMKAHEDLARACLIYLRSKELQLGWLGQKKTDEFGMILADDDEKELLKNRIKENVFLEYSARNWSYHARQCEDRGVGDVYDLALNIMSNYPEAVRCSFQVQQYMNMPERETYWPVSPTLLVVVSTDSVIMTQRFLNDREVNIDAVDLTGSNALMICGGHEPLQDCPDAGAVIGKLLIERGADLSLVDRFGRSAMHWAAANGQVDLLRQFLEKKADAGLHALSGETPLHESTLAETTESLELLIDAGVDLEAVDDEECTPLHLAVRSDRKDMVQILLKHGASILAKDEDHWTPLHVAATRGREDIVGLLIKANSDIHARTILASTAVHLAAERGFWRTILMLVENQASIDEQNFSKATPLVLASEDGHETTVSLLLSLGADPNIPAKAGDTALHLAAFGGHTNVVRILLEYGAQVDLPANDGWTPLQIAISEGNIAIVSLILTKIKEQGGLNTARDNGATALHQAALKGNADILHLLLEAKADVEARSKVKETPIFWGIEAGQPETIKTLLDHGANPNSENDLGYTVLYTAAVNGNAEIIQHLLFAGADVDHRSSTQSWTALQVAASYGKHEALDLLLKSNAFVNNAGVESVQPLHLAAQNGHIECVKLLIEAGAKMDGLSEKNHTPFFLALHWGNIEVIEYMMSMSEKIQAGSRASEKIDAEKDSVFSAPDNSESRLEAVKFLLGDVVSPLFATQTKVVNFPISDQTTFVLEYLLDRNLLDLHRTDEDGWTLLHWAIYSQSVKAIEIVLARKPDVTTKAKDGRTVLHLAAKSSLPSPQLEVLVGQSDQLKIDEYDDDLCTPLHVAALQGNQDATEFFIKKGANTTLQNSYGETIFHFAVRNRDEGPLNYLLKLLSEIAINQPKNDGETCLHIACRLARKPVVEKLLKCGGNINLLDERGWQCLHSAIHGGDPDVVNLVLNAGADVNKSDKGGYTPLHLAMIDGNEKILETLLQRGARSVPEQNGWTPRDIAEAHGFSHVWDGVTGVWSASSPKSLQMNTSGPTRWSNEDKPKELKLSEDGCIVELPEGLPMPRVEQKEVDGLPEIDFFSRGYSIRSDFCIPFDAEKYYFEVRVLSDQNTGSIAVGFSDHTMSLRSWPGWSEATGWGYHGDDGKFFDTSGEEALYETYSSDDVVGCGLDLKNHTIFITKNNKFQGIVAENVRGQLYPVVGLIYPGSKVEARFGLQIPEEWDLEGSTISESQSAKLENSEEKIQREAHVELDVAVETAVDVGHA